jgi:hypothetical protein
MSEFTDDTLGRYVAQQPGMREALLRDPVQHQQAERLRQTLDAFERAMADECVPDEARRRAINRVVWGEPEGHVDVWAQVREQVLAAYDLPIELTDAWKAIHDGAGPVRPDGDPATTRVTLDNSTARFTPAEPLQPYYPDEEPEPGGGAVSADRREHILNHLYKLFYGDLDLCGCGRPADAYELIRDIISLAPFFENERWRLVESLIGNAGAHHIVLSALENADLIEHGSSISGSWLTPKGKWCQAVMRGVEFEDIDGISAGYPHDGGECTIACWLVPVDPEVER